VSYAGRHMVLGKSDAWSLAGVCLTGRSRIPRLDDRRELITGRLASEQFRNGGTVKPMMPEFDYWEPITEDVATFARFEQPSMPPNNAIGFDTGSCQVQQSTIKHEWHAIFR